ncbi:MAG: tetratricopeptide repeat protein [Flavobacteriaceae bacterium]
MIFKKTPVVLLTILFATFSMESNACSMYKLTKNGKTLVGNNEDWYSPNGQFWFEIGDKDTFGVMYMGFLDNFAQGAINEAGLMFDGFWEPYLEVRNTKGKLEIPIGDALKNVMQTMVTVEEVRSYLQTINLSSLVDGQIVLVDRSGTYLIVEGDEMFIGDEDEKTFSNFYYSQVASVDEVRLDYYQKGRSYIKATDMESTLGYCSEAMEHFAQSGLAPTQYSTVYDLNTLTIRVYLFHDFSNFIELDLRDEMKKGNHRTMIADLFPKESIGHAHYRKYNDPGHPTLFLEEFLGDADISEQEFLDNGLDNIINGLGYEWLHNIKNPTGAIKVFQYGVSLMPNHANLHERLGEAYFANNDWNNAITHYAKSLSLNPGNDKAVEMIVKAHQLRN